MAVIGWLRMLWVAGMLAQGLHAQTQQEQDIIYLLERPYDPLTVPRAGGNVVFSLPGEEAQLTTRFGGTVSPSINMVVPARNDMSATRLGAATSLARGRPFSQFLESHRRAARDLVAIFMRARDSRDLMQIAATVRESVNEEMFVYALSLTVLQRTDLRDVRLPSLVEILPNQFVPQQHITQAQNEVNRRPPGQMTPVVIDHGPEFSGSLVKPEHRLNYWREDYGMNNHHWHWHLIFPVGMGVNRDRKGEIFYYKHQQMMARYDMERLSVGLNLVESFENWREPIPDGYFSKLTVGNSGRNYGTRQDNTVLSGLRREVFGEDSLDVTQVEVWRSRVLSAIHQGHLINTQGQQVPLTDDTTGKRGIDYLGDLIESDRNLSVNHLFYGDVHNFGHILIAVSHDPDNAHLEELGPIGIEATSARDPAFYRLHRFIDDLFVEYKQTLQPYPVEELLLPGLEVQRVGVVSGGRANQLVTGWNTREFEASRGIDFASETPVILRLTHLDYQTFNYHILVNNRHTQSRRVNVRIYLAPKFNSAGREMSFLEQRRLWIEMDKFTVTLNSGSNHLERSSTASSITNTRELTFRDLERPPPGTREDLEFNHCGCGWPQHLLLPRGRPEGMTFQLFVLLSDYERDLVVQPPITSRCTNGLSYCGILDAQFPDRRPMGFPFDRLPLPQLLGRPVTSAADYARLDNAFLHDITITFTNAQLQQK